MDDKNRFCRSLSDEYKEVCRLIEIAKKDSFSKEFNSLAKRLKDLVEIKDAFYAL